jgi:hypothetical protein
MRYYVACRGRGFAVIDAVTGAVAKTYAKRHDAVLAALALDA